jgi:hypothetical protein
MSNMSYCRFGNTLEDLIDCRDTMRGDDEYYQSRDDISDEEYSNMEQLVEICRNIIDINDNSDNVFILEGGGSEN